MEECVMYKRDGYVHGDWLRNTGYYLDNKYISSDNKEGYCYIWDRVEVGIGSSIGSEQA